MWEAAQGRQACAAALWLRDGRGEPGCSLPSLVPLKGTLCCRGGRARRRTLERAVGQDALRKLLLRFLEARTGAAVMRVNLKTATATTQESVTQESLSQQDAQQSYI